MLRKSLPTMFPGQGAGLLHGLPAGFDPSRGRAPPPSRGAASLKQSDDNFWKYHDWIYANQESVTPDNYNAKLMEWAGTGGVDSVQLGRCVDSKATDAEVDPHPGHGTHVGR